MKKNKSSKLVTHINSLTQTYMLIGNKPITLIDLYLENRLAYYQLLTDKHYNISTNCIKILETDLIPDYISKQEKKSMYLYLFSNGIVPNKHNTDKIITHFKIQELKNLKIEKKLLQATFNNTITWNIEQNLHLLKQSTKIYTVTYLDIFFRFQVISYQKERSWVSSYKFTWYISKNIQGNCYNGYNNYLFKAIQNQKIQNFKKTKNSTQSENINSLKENPLNQTDVIIKTNIFKCIKSDHIIHEFIALIPIVTTSGKIEIERVPAGYCQKCKCYFILKSVFKNISEKGVLLIHLLTLEQYNLFGNNIHNLSKESILMANGYNVKASIDLSDEQRIVILTRIVDANILTPHKICSYIDGFISNKHNLPQYANAVNKWIRDKNFIINYKNNLKPEIVVKNISIH